MDFQMKWTPSALEAEYEEFGMDRIAKAHNAIVEDLKHRLETQMFIARTMTDGLIQSVGGFPNGDE